jgi:hypothetical protein
MITISRTILAIGCIQLVPGRVDFAGFRRSQSRTVAGSHTVSTVDYVAMAIRRGRVLGLGWSKFAPVAGLHSFLASGDIVFMIWPRPGLWFPASLVSMDRKNPGRFGNSLHFARAGREKPRPCRRHLILSGRKCRAPLCRHPDSVRSSETEPTPELKTDLGRPVGPEIRVTPVHVAAFLSAVMPPRIASKQRALG